MAPWFLTLAGLALTIALVLIGSGTKWGKNVADVDHARDHVADVRLTVRTQGKTIAEHATTLGVHGEKLKNLETADGKRDAQLVRFENETRASLSGLHGKVDDLVTALIAGRTKGTRSGVGMLTTAESDPET